MDLTFGTGIAEVVDYQDDGPVLTVVIGSLSSNLVSAGQRLGTYNYNGWGGIYNDWYDPFAEEAAATAAVEAAPAAVEAAAVAPAAAVEAAAVAPAAPVSAPEVAAVEVDRPVAGETSASTDSAVSAADVAVADTGSSADAGAATADASAPTTAASDAPAPTAAASDTSAPTKAKATRGQARGASAGS